jgi:glycosyltransferase involved in cell wall biosynthesis
MTGSRVLVVSLSDLASDARVLRQIDFLRGDYDVIAAAFGSSPALGDVQFVELAATTPATARAKAEAAGRAALRRAGLYDRAYRLDGRVRLWRRALAPVLPVDAIVVNDLFALPLAFMLAPATPVVYDAHEHWTSESASWTRSQRLSMGRAHEWIVDRFVPRAAGLMTVSPGIARDFEQRTGVAARLVTNAPYFRSLEPSPVGEPIRLVHVGVSDPRRRLESSIEAMRLLDERFALDIILARDNEYRRRVAQMVEGDPAIRLLPAVPQAELIETLNAYDIGVHLFPGNDPNQVYSLPNKLFDYVQARLAVAIGPSPEMAAIVREWDCGIVSDSFEPRAFADALGALGRSDVERLKQNADLAAAELTAEKNRETVLGLVRGALSRPSASAATASY